MNGAYIDVCNPIFEALQAVNTRKRYMHIIKERIKPAQQALKTQHRRKNDLSLWINAQTSNHTKHYHTLGTETPI
jgi:hypothetical protein